jgi:hypothetical protein
MLDPDSSQSGSTTNGIRRFAGVQLTNGEIEIVGNYTPCGTFQWGGGVSEQCSTNHVNRFYTEKQTHKKRSIGKSF